MTLNEIAYIFNRSFSYAFNLKKSVSMAIVLALCGLMVIFFRSLAYEREEWMALSLTFMPIFLCAGILISAGILSIRIYHDEVKGKKVSYRDTVSRSWEILIGASYFFVPIILCYLLLWMLMGIFVLMSRIPFLGEFIGVLLSFMPFLLNLGALVLCVLNIAILFFITPAIALRGLHGTKLSEGLAQRLREDLFSNLFLLLIALLPLLIVLGMLSGAALLTSITIEFGDFVLVNAVRWFLMMIPFVFVLSPALLFFFNFSAESHVLLHKRKQAL